MLVFEFEVLYKPLGCRIVQLGAQHFEGVKAWNRNPLVTFQAVGAFSSSTGCSGACARRFKSGAYGEDSAMLCYAVLCSAMLITHRFGVH